MEKKNAKKEIVKMLLNKNLDVDDEEQLLDMLIDEPISIDVDKIAISEEWICSP